MSGSLPLSKGETVYLDHIKWDPGYWWPTSFNVTDANRRPISSWKSDYSYVNLSKHSTGYYPELRKIFGEHGVFRYSREDGASADSEILFIGPVGNGPLNNALGYTTFESSMEIGDTIHWEGLHIYSLLVTPTV